MREAEALSLIENTLSPIAESPFPPLLLWGSLKGWVLTKDVTWGRGLKPLISYYGGKQRIASRIVDVIQTIPHTVYSEPFVGGGAVLYKLFEKGRPPHTNKDHYREVINDKNELIANLYRVAREQPQELQRRLELTLYSQADYRDAKAICKAGSDDPVALAWAVYVTCNMSFANKMGAGWGCGVVSRNSAATWANRVDLLPRQIERLKDVHIGCEDALRFIERWDSPQTLHYCDPPYPGTVQGHYSGYSLADFHELVETLKQCQGSFILSNYHQDFEGPSDWQRVEIQTSNSSSGKGKVDKGRDKSRAATAEELGDRRRTEVLWFCDRSANIRPGLIDIAYRHAGALVNEQSVLWKGSKQIATTGAN